ncbi:hypothetical protein NCC49_003561 [Naganishia albida]|nr:hypothetical protein NCC49_003561 [Naganishia albida]
MPPSRVPESLLLFTTSQTPLAVRYPTPENARSLLIPPLLHASLHLAVDRPSPSMTLTEEGVLMIPNPEDRIDEINGNRSIGDVEPEKVEEANDDSEITVKFHIVSDSPALESEDSSNSSTSVQRQISQISRALRNLEHYKSSDPRWRGQRARKGIDTFLIGWKGVEYRGEKRPAEEGEESGVAEKAAKLVNKVVGSAKLMSKLNADAEREERRRQESLRLQGGLLTNEQKNAIGQVWADLPNLVPQAKKLGTLSLPLPLLQYLGNTAGSSISASNSNPSYNSTPSDAGVQSVKRSHELEQEYQHKLEQEEGPRAHHKAPSGSDPEQHDVVNEKDKSLLAELIPNPSGGDTVAEEGSARSSETKKLLTGTASLPAVNCMDTPDCHWLPEDLLNYAKDNGIELWAGGGGEGSDPLPSAHLHNTLQEFITKLPSGLFKAGTSLDQLVPLDDESRAAEPERTAGVEVEWVLGYTVISKSRNIVQDKGYIIAAAVL